MAPKSRSKSLARAETQKKALKKSATTAAVTTEKKQVDLSFLEEVDSSIDENRIPKVFQLLGFGLAQGDRQCLLAACSAVERICQDKEGFITLVKAKGVETMLSFLRHLPQAHVSPATSEAVNAAAAAIFQRASTWLDEVDEVDFDQLQHVLHLAFWLGSEDEDVALSALGAIERFTLYRSENGATLLQSDVLQVLHRIIGHNRAPELVSEAFTLLYRLCDAPAPAVVPLVTDESDLVRTVVESMIQAPLNMRLQLAGIRLLALWSQFDLGEDPAISDQKDLKQFIREANGYEVRGRSSQISSGQGSAMLLLGCRRFLLVCRRTSVAKSPKSTHGRLPRPVVAPPVPSQNEEPLGQSGRSFGRPFALAKRQSVPIVPSASILASAWGFRVKGKALNEACVKISQDK